MSVSTVRKILHTSAPASGNMKGKARKKKTIRQRESEQQGHTEKKQREGEKRIE